MVSIPACHAGDRGSIPRRGAQVLKGIKSKTNEINGNEGNEKTSTTTVPTTPTRPDRIRQYGNQAIAVVVMTHEDQWRGTIEV